MPERALRGALGCWLLVRNVREEKGRLVGVFVRWECPFHPDSSLVPVEGEPAQGARRRRLPDASNSFIIGVEGEIDREVVIVQRRERQLDRIEPHSAGIGDGNWLHWTNRRVGQDNARTLSSAQRDLLDFKHRAPVPRNLV